MKKLFACLLILIIAVLPSCAPKDYPVEDIKLGEYSTGSVIERESGEVLEPELSPLVKNTSVEAFIGDEALEIKEGNVVSVPFGDVGEEALEIKLTAKRYNEAVLMWTVKSLPHPLDLKVEGEKELYFNEGTAEFTVNAEVSRENAEISLEPSQSGEFIPDEEQEEGKTKGKIIFKLPGAGSTEYKITASAPNSEEKEETLKVHIIPKLHVTADREVLALSPGEKSKITVSIKEEGAYVSASVTKGDAKAILQDDSSIDVTGGKEASKLYIKVQKEGYVPFEKIINIENADPFKEIYEEGTRDRADIPSAETVIDGIIRETNKIRKANGLNALTRVYSVDAPAALRAKETAAVWSHTRPDGRSCFTVFDDLGLSFKAMGENLFSANYYIDPAKVLEQWMASPGHRANILNPVYTGMSAGFYQGSSYNYWTQLFVK